jgi:uncharacterized protein
VIAANERQINEASRELQKLGGNVEAVEADLATLNGLDTLYAAAKRMNRPVDALLANAGRGLGRAFLDQDFSDVKCVVDTNVTSTLYLVQKVWRDMRARGAGRILITGSIAGLLPGTYQAVYNGTEAFLDSFSYALRHELQDSGVSVTCLMPGATETEFFERAHARHEDRDGKKDDPVDVAKQGFDAMMRGDGHVITGWQNKLQAATPRSPPRIRSRKCTAAKPNRALLLPISISTRSDSTLPRRGAGPASDER